MATPDLKSLPLEARRLIKQLRTENTALKGENDQLRSDLMKRRARAYPPGKKTYRGAIEPNIRRPHASRGDTLTAAPTGLAGAVARGEAAKIEWVKTGEVVRAQVLADHWGLTPQALGPAAARGEVFAVTVKRQRFYPKEFLVLERDDVGAVTKALGELAPEDKLIFWKRPHGALGGKTVLESLSSRTGASELARVTQLAQSWAAQAQSAEHTEKQDEPDVAAAA